jgi:hypothetical protein
VDHGRRRGHHALGDRRRCGKDRPRRPGGGRLHHGDPLMRFLYGGAPALGDLRSAIERNACAPPGYGL